MKIKKILVVPSSRIINSESNLPSRRFKNTMRKIKNIFRKRFLIYDGELIFYADIPKILGKDNVYVLGVYHSHLLDPKIQQYCPYPSCHGTPAATFIDEKELSSVMAEVDAVLISTRSGNRGDMARIEAGKQSVPIAIFDFTDHEANYGSKNIKDKLCYDYQLGRDYNLYFKKDLPLGFETDTIQPIAPVPVRVGSYDFSIYNKDYSVFYSGRGREDKCQNDRKETIDLVYNSDIKNTLLIDHNDRKTLMTTREYWDNISKSNFCLSPSGRVWDSFRHAEIGLSPNTAIIAPKPYVHTVGPKLIDGVNSILYDTELVGGKYSLKNKSKLLEKINYYINNDSKRVKLAEQWSSDVVHGHTTYSRSMQLIKKMQECF
tara:strand:- start:12447 stop:13571 length:1125 start_codon:yes stop_codon:yes gene_type:complete